jgi:hypothetical protein
MDGTNLESIFENIVFPNEVIKGKQIENIIVSPIDDSIAVVVLSGKLKNKYLLRLYQLHRGEDQKYFPTHEIGAFTFYSRKELKDFVNNLRKMSAIEILMLMNPEPSLTH